MRLTRGCVLPAVVLAGALGCGRRMDPNAGSREPTPPGMSALARQARSESFDAMTDREAMRATVLLFEDPTVPRTEILDRLDAYLHHFPHGFRANDAKEYRDTLASMIDEDRQHTTAALDSLSGDALVAELIFRLRDQNAHQFCQPCTCSVFDTRDPQSPAHRLAAIGRPAVPQLLGAVDDKRLSRSVRYWRDFGFDHSVLRVGDCALQVLERIAARNFQSKADAVAWWQDVGQRGEDRVLAERVSSGSAQPEEIAHYAASYPDTAFDALTKARARQLRSAQRRAVAEALGTLADPRVIALLVEEARLGPYLGARVAAARALTTRGRPEGRQAMVDTAAHLADLAPTLDTTADTDWEAASNFTAFVVHNDVRTAFDGLAVSWSQLPWKAREEIVTHVAEPTSFPPAPDDTKAPSDATKSASEAFLVRALDDVESFAAKSGGHSSLMQGDKRIDDPRICDLAADALASLVPSRYSFDLGAPIGDRNRAIATMRQRARSTRPR